MKAEKVRKQFLDNKGWTAAGVLMFLILFGAAGFLANSMDLASHGSMDITQDSRLGAESILPPVNPGSSGSYVEVQEASLEIDSGSIEDDISRIEDAAEGFEGWIESSSKNHGELYTSAYVTVKVPSEDFQEFMSTMKQEFEIESYNVRNYRLYTEDEEDELDVLNETLSDYEDIRQEIKQMENDEEKLDLLLKITEKQLEVKEKQRNYENRLADKQQRGDYATVNVKLREKRDIDWVPEDLGQKFKNEVNQMIENIVDTLITTVTGGVEVFFTAVKYLIYMLIVAVPVLAFYRIGRRVYGKVI